MPNAASGSPTDERRLWRAFIDGESEAVDTVQFALDGTDYEIDLLSEHIDELRGGLMPYIKAARKVGAGPSRRQTTAAPKRSREGLGEVGACLAEHGYPVKERGRMCPLVACTPSCGERRWHRCRVGVTPGARERA
jgi:hypothetical protein